MNFLVSAVTHLPPIKVAQRKQYKELPSPQVGSHQCFCKYLMLAGPCWMVNDNVLFYLPGCKECPLGQPGALQPAAGVRQHLRQLVWLHASGPLSVSIRPRALQRSSVRPAQEVQRPGESVKNYGQNGQKGWKAAWRSGLVVF